MNSPSPFWCAETLAITVSGPSGHTKRVVDKPFARIGSHPASEVVLSGPGIAPRCIYLHATPEGVYYVRLEKGRGAALGGGAWLAPGERLVVGNYEITAQLKDRVPSILPKVRLTAWGSASGRLPVVEISAEGRPCDKRRFRARLSLVGRRHELALQVMGQQVSSFHCALFWDQDQLWCVDLVSSNGTFVGKHKVECAQVPIGQVIGVGEFSLLFKRLSMSERRSAWRSADSNPDVLDSAVVAPTLPPSGSLAQTTSQSTGDTGKTDSPATGTPAIPLLDADDIRQTREMILQVRDSLQHERKKLEEDFATRSQELAAQQHEIDQYWQRASSELTAKVSQLQTKAEQLTEQQQMMEDLRATLEQQRRLSAELLQWQRELARRSDTIESRSEDQDELGASRSDIGEAASIGVLGEDLSDSQGRFPGEDTADEQIPYERPIPGHTPGILTVSVALARPSAPRYGETIIESTHIVDHDSSNPREAVRSTPWKVPAGRSKTSTASAGEGPPSGAASSAVTTGQGAEAITDASPRPAPAQSTALIPATIGRKARSEPDKMSVFVTDRLILREQARRIWLRILWGVAAVVLIAAASAAGYLALLSQ